jgi:hypothetical protein
MIVIELSAPARLQNKPVRQQSLWFLLKLWLSSQSGDGSGWLRAAELREQFSSTRHIRMLVSRAFIDFAHWGLRVGWGKDRSKPCEMLAISGRNRGPFWLLAGEAEKIQLRLNGNPAGLQDVSRWLGPTLPSALENDVPIHAASPAYWQAWTSARRDMLDGQLIVDGEHGALAGFRRAHQLASDPWLQALALLQQAMVWRRAGNADAARTSLAELERYWHDARAPEQAWLGAMAAIVRAWCAYANRDNALAQQLLRQALADTRWLGLFQHHPRIRCEYANLQALIQRAFALDEKQTQTQREAAADRALQHYQQALAQANEADLFDAAASAASNLGWSLWLFERARVPLQNYIEHPPLAWLELAHHIAARHSLQGGCWNSIYLLRIVRAGGPTERHPNLTVFRRWPVQSPKQLEWSFAEPGAQTRHASLKASLLPNEKTWLALVKQIQADVDHGKIQVDALQRANLLLEVAWYEAHQGDLARSAIASQRLKRRLRELTSADRVFFREALRTLPIA